MENFSSLQSLNMNMWEFWVGTLVFSMIAYMIGSISGGKIVSKAWKVDLAEHGSGNFGATNAGRVHGPIGFLVVFLIDFSKGLVAALSIGAVRIWGSHPIFIEGNVNIALFFVVVGHSWPLWFKFQGGKGVATTFGVAAVINWIFALAGGITFIIMILATKKVSLSSIVAIVMMAVLSPLQMFIPLDFVFEWSKDWGMVVSFWLMAGLSLFRHRENIYRLIKGEESTATAPDFNRKPIKGNDNEAK